MKTLDRLGKIKKAIGGMLAILLLIAGVFFAGVFYASRSSEPKITSTNVFNQLQEVNELTTLEYHYTKVGKFENSLTLNGWEIPLTKKSFLLTYQGIVKFGVDMSLAEVVVKNHEITVVLPDIEVISNVIDESSIEVYDETRNLFNPIKIEDYANFATQQKDMVEEEALENGLFSQAATKAEAVIVKLLQMIPEVEQDYTIKVVFAQSEKKNDKDGNKPQGEQSDNENSEQDLDMDQLKDPEQDQDINQDKTQVKDPQKEDDVDQNKDKNNDDKDYDDQE
ncbi:MAG: DUF4230 domain-containing protein [Erysipelotrichaceae bacterium]|nr:DUF4230 domain-containing protein [Erysipelotrichaceae bacterium]